ncbi:MAG: CAP domain-containing protein [Flavobacteriaceae bacterium]
MRISILNSSKYYNIALLSLFLCFSCSKDSNDPGEPIDIPTDNTARQAAKKLYEDFYLTSVTDGNDPSWSGDEPSCNAGSTPEAIKDKIFMRLTYYRSVVGLNNEISENPTKSSGAQQAALMMKANNQLEHFPPNSWKCYTEAGKDGAGSSLLTMSRNAEAIDSYMRDQGANNGPVGHRRWLLWPRLQEIGIGNTDSSNAIWVIGNAGTAPADAPEFIAWPPEGYIPDNMVFPRWSFSITGADFTATKISMKDQDGASISLQIEPLNNAFGDRTIVWVPSAVSSNVTEDTAYSVTLEDVEVDGELRDYEYTVILFEPND